MYLKKYMQFWNQLVFMQWIFLNLILLDSYSVLQELLSANLTIVKYDIFILSI